MPIGTPLHSRTLAICQSLSFRVWAGYYAANAYEPHHEHEYAAIRHSAGLIDVSPLYKYEVSGPGATTLVDRIITRSAARMAVGQVIYTPWCDARGKVIDDGTITRLDKDRYRWTAADPSLRWFRLNAGGLDVAIDDISDRLAALALQGPMAARVLADASNLVPATLAYFRMAPARIGGIAVEVSRTGYTGDLGYEVWVPADSAVRVWDALIDAGRPHGLRPAGMLALDVVRIEAGLLLIDVDFVSSARALSEEQYYTPAEMGLGRLVHLDKPGFVGRKALVEEQRHGVARTIVGLELDWEGVEGAFDRHGLAPAVGTAPSRQAVPVLGDGRQTGKATSTTWSPILKKLVALATVDHSASTRGTRLEYELTVEGTRHLVPATVVGTPFFDPPRKRSMPDA